MPTIQAERTCSWCMHWERHDNSMGWCNNPEPCVSTALTSRTYACPQFNAPTVLYWEFGPASAHWWLCGKFGVPVGSVEYLDAERGWYARLFVTGKPIAYGTLNDCARALVDRVKERTNG